MKRPLAVLMVLPAFLLAAIGAQAQDLPGIWSDPGGAPVKVYIGGGVLATDADTLYVHAGFNLTANPEGKGFYRHTLSTGAWTRLEDVPAMVSVGGTMAYLPERNAIYLLRGDASKDFYRYDLAAGAWTALSDDPLLAYPETVGDGFQDRSWNYDYSASMTAAGGKLYVINGRGSRAFYEFTPDTGWLRVAWTPVAVGVGCALAYPGGDFIYALGGKTTAFWRYNLRAITVDGQGALTWLAIAAAPASAANGAALAAGPGGTLYAFLGGGLHRFSPDFALTSKGLWSAMPATPASVGGGAGIAWTGGDLLHCLRGAVTGDLWRYSVSGGRFVTALTPAPLTAGAPFSGAGNGNDLYAFSGQKLLHYSIADDRWTEKRPAPNTLGAGAALVHAGGVHLYATAAAAKRPVPGGYSVEAATPDFWRYHIPSDTWETDPAAIAQAPVPFGWGSVAAWGGGDHIYALAGGNSGQFYRYSIPLNRWEAMTGAPAIVSNGSAISWPGSGDFLYVLRGSDGTVATSTFWRYAMTGANAEGQAAGTWTTIAPCPSPVQPGSSIAALGGFLFAITGDSGRDVSVKGPGRMFMYSVADQRWSPKTDLPGATGFGAGLAAPGIGAARLYAIQGGSRLLWSYFPDFSLTTGVAPAAPEIGPSPAQGQFRSDGSSIEVGGMTWSAVTFQGSAIHPEGSDWRMELEFKRTWIPFDGNNTRFSLFVPSGQAASVEIASTPYGNNPLSGGSYHWRARALDPTGAASAWVSFGGNLDGGLADADFEYSLITTSGMPPDPVDAAQMNLVDLTPIDPMGTSAECGFVARATISDAYGSRVRLAVEVQPLGTPFTGTPTAVGPLVVDNTLTSVEIGGLPSASPVRWQYRVVSEDGRSSRRWVPFGSDPATPDFTTPDSSGNSAPLEIDLGPSGTAAGQFLLDGVRRLHQGETTREDGVSLRGVTADPDSNSWRIEVELKRTTLPFDGLGTSYSPFVRNGQSATAAFQPLSDGDYHWRARAVDSAGATSSWVAFGWNHDEPSPGAPAEADFDVRMGATSLAPAHPDDLLQLRLDETTLIPAAGGTDEPGFIIQGRVSDQDGDMVALQVEVRATDTDFVAPSATGPLAPNGSVAWVKVGGLISNRTYHWRARAIDARGNASLWISFGANPEDRDEVDIQTLPNLQPEALGFDQHRASTGATARRGELLWDETAVVFRVEAVDADGDFVQLLVEVQPAGAPFTSAPGSVFTSGQLLGGGRLEVTAPLSPGSYHWRFKLVDSYGNHGAWTRFSESGSEADFVLRFYGGSLGDRNACGGSAARPGAAFSWTALAGLLALLLRRRA